MIIAIDAMGGDHAPDSIVNGSIDALGLLGSSSEIVLVGNSAAINKIIQKRGFVSNRLKVVHASEVIENDDLPLKAVRSKKDSSMAVGLNLIKQGEADVFLSAGNTGALMAGSLLILGRIEGVDRPALASVFPSKKGAVLLLDAGANTVCKPANYVQFGIMGSIYMKEVLGVADPKVGLLNVGSEYTKGNEVIKQAYTLLSSSPDINFSGNIEGRDVLAGDVNVIVCDGFIGNILLKFGEGMGMMIFDTLKGMFTKNWLTKLSALITKKGLRDFKKTFDYTEYGGVPLMGINGNVIKSHGSSNAKAIKNAILVSSNLAKNSVLQQIKDQFQNSEVTGVDFIEQDD